MSSPLKYENVEKEYISNVCIQEVSFLHIERMYIMNVQTHDVSFLYNFQGKWLVGLEGLLRRQANLKSYNFEVMRFRQ